MTPPVLWTPPDSLLQRCALGAYRRERGFDTYDELWQWSVTDLEGVLGLDLGSLRRRRARRDVLASDEMPGAQWFPGTLRQLRRARVPRQVRAWRSSPAARTARTSSGRGTQLRELTARIAAGLRALGVERGDRVVAYMPNIPETTAAFLACASLGAVWSSCSPDFGPRSVIDRFAQIEPKVLLAVRTYRYNGREFDRSRGAGRDHGGDGRADGDPRRGVVGRADGASRTTLEFERVAFDHPLWVLYSSGTTGLPKAIVQSQGGILLEHLKMLHLHVDAQPGDRLFWFTTTGWMMWNFIVSGLLTEATILLYDGSPGLPGHGRAVGLRGAHRHDDVRHERELHRRVHEGGRRARGRPRSVRAEGRRLDRLAALARGLPLGLRARRTRTPGCSRPAAAPTCARRSSAACPSCRSTRASCRRARWAPRSSPGTRTGTPHIGEVGELVLTRPMPSMPIYFWGDDDGSRYREAYFETYPGIWRHGDWIEITDRGTAIISGRSRRHHQPRRHPHGHGRDLPRRAGRRRRHRRAGGRRAGRGRGRVDAAVRRAARGRVAERRGRSPRSASACARTARHGTSRAR